MYNALRNVVRIDLHLYRTVVVQVENLEEEREAVRGRDHGHKLQEIDAPLLIQLAMLNLFRMTRDMSLIC